MRTPWLKMLVLSAPLLVCHSYGKRLIFSLIFSLPLRCAPPKVPSVIEEERPPTCEARMLQAANTHWQPQHHAS